MATQSRRASARGRHKSRNASMVLVAIAVVGVLTLVILGDAALSHNRIHSGVSIQGVDVGRTSREDAAASIGGLVKASAAQPATVTSPQQKWEVLPADVGTDIDVQATVDSAYATTRSGNFVGNTVRRLRLFFSSKDLPLKGTVDPEKMDRFIGKVAKALDHPPVNAGLKIESGKISVTEGTPGTVVDQKQLRDRLTGLFLTLQTGSFEVPMVTAQPAIKAADTTGAVSAAKIMLGSPVALTFGDMVWEVTPDQIQTAVDFRVEGEGAKSTLVPYISAKKASAFFGPISEKIGTKPKNRELGDRRQERQRSCRLRPARNSTPTRPPLR